MAAGTFTGTAMATAVTMAPAGQRGRYMQVISMGQALAALIGVPFGAWLAAQFGWRSHFLMIASLAGFAALDAVHAIAARHAWRHPEACATACGLLRNPGVGGALLSTLLFMIGSSPVMVYIGALTGGGRDRLRGAAADPARRRHRRGGVRCLGWTDGRSVRRRYRSVWWRVSRCCAVLMAYASLPLLPRDLALPGMLLVVAVQGYVGRTYSIAVASHMAHLVADFGAGCDLAQHVDLHGRHGRRRRRWVASWWTGWARLRCR